MEKPTKCADCGGRLEPGAVVDYGLSTARPSEWAEGALDVSVWTGGVRNDRRLEIVAYRCEQCGLLRLYAERPAGQPRWP